MIIFIYGQDTFRAKEKLNELKNKFVIDVDPSKTSIKELDGENIDMSAISEASGASSLFASKRMIIVKNISQNKNKEIFKEIKSYLQKIEKDDLKESNIFIFIDESDGEGKKRNVLWQYLLTQRFTQNFSILSATAASAWVVKRAGKEGAHITRSASSKLTALFGSDLWRLNNEIKKLINYKNASIGKLIEESTTEINENDIELMCRGKVDENIFAFSDAIANKQKGEAMKLLENEIEAGVASTYLMHMIIRQFRILIQVRHALEEGLSQRKISNELKLHPYVVQKSIKQAGNFTQDKLKNIFSSLVKLDKDIKTGKAEFMISVDILFAKL